MQTNYIVMMKPKACKVWTPAAAGYHAQIAETGFLSGSNFFHSIRVARHVCRVLNKANIKQWMAGIYQYSRLEFKVGVITTE